MCLLLQVQTGLEESRSSGQVLPPEGQNNPISRNNDFKGHGLLSEVLWTRLDTTH